MTLLDIWNGADAKTRANFIADICKRYPSLVCEILKAQSSCTSSVIKEINGKQEGKRLYSGNAG